MGGGCELPWACPGALYAGATAGASKDSTPCTQERACASNS